MRRKKAVQAPVAPVETLTPTETTPTLDTKQAQELAAKERQIRSDKAATEIAEVLAKHNCVIDATMTAHSTGNSFNLRVIARD